MITDAAELVVSLLGRECVMPMESNLAYQVDGLVPKAVVQIQESSQIQAVLNLASQQNLGVTPWGGGTHQFLGNKPARLDIVLDMHKYDRILDFQPADLTVTVESGITLDKLKSQLISDDKLVPLESPLSDVATIGGIVATNRSGPLRYSYGLPRDWLIGSTVCGAGGQQTKSGGKVVKNVTGYDLGKLYSGSLGTLGVISEVTFKLAPSNPAAGVIVGKVDSIDEAVQISKELLAKVYSPQGIQIVDNLAMKTIGYPLLHTGLTYGVMLFFCGRIPAVNRRMRECEGLLESSGIISRQVFLADEADKLLTQTTNTGSFVNDIPECLMKFNVSPDKLLGVTQRSQAILGNIPTALLADPGFGVIRLACYYSSIVSTSEFLACVQSLRNMVSQHNGSLIIERCSYQVKEAIDVWGDDTPEVKVMANIKKQFDPKMILNQGRFMGHL